MSNPNPFDDEEGDTGLGSPYSQVQPNTGVNNENASGTGAGTYGNNLTVPTGFTDPNGHTIQYGGFAQGMNQSNVDAGQQQNTLNQLNQMAQGKGPSAATDLLKQQTQEAMSNNNAMASSGSGQTGQAGARRTAMMANTGALQTLGGQAATARAQEQIGAMSAAGNMATNMRNQDVGQAQAFDQAAQGQAALNQGASQLAQQQSQFNTGTMLNLGSSGAGAAAGLALLADGDLGDGARVGTSDFKEPGGAAHWTIREEKGFILAVNQRTGQMFKLATAPLSQSEKKEAMAPHGAGPIKGPDSQRAHKQMADGDLGGDERFASMVRQAHPGLYRAATSGQKSYSDGDLPDMDTSISAPSTSSPATGTGFSPTQSAAKSAFSSMGSSKSSPTTPMPAMPSYADGDLDDTPSTSWAPPPGGNKAAEQLRDPSYGESDLNDEMARSAYGGRDSGGNEYAVAGYTPPTVSPSRYNDDEAGHQLSEDALQGQLDKLRYGQGPQSREDVQAATAKANGQPAPKGEDDGPRWGRMIGGALLGFSNPSALAKYAQQQPKAGQAKKPGSGSTMPATTPLPVKPVAYPADYAEAFGPPKSYSDGDLKGNDLSMAVERAYADANRRIQGARAAEEAKGLLAQLREEKQNILKSIDYTPEDERSLLPRRRGTDSGSVELSVGPEGRVLQGLGYGSFDRVALDDADRGGKVTVGEIEQHPGEYPDGELNSDRRGSEDNPVDLDAEIPDADEPADLDVYRAPRGKKARKSFDKDLADERAILESQRAPVDLDAYVPSADDPYGWAAPENVERVGPVQEDPAAIPARFPDPDEDRKVRRMARDFDRMNPYREHPALATLFPAQPKVGPTDWMTALHAANRKYDAQPNPLAADVAAFERGGVEDAAHEKAMRKLGLDLVPGEAETIDMDEARKRTKNRMALRTLMAQWEQEKKARARYSDADLNQETEDKTRVGNEQAKAKQVRRAVDTSDSMPKSYKDADLVTDPADRHRPTMQLTRTGNDRKANLQQQLHDLEDEEEVHDKETASRSYKDGDLKAKGKALASLFGKSKPHKGSGKGKAA
ncbi:MAG TPA: hypothetical protein VGG39_23355 [Polyangiaceae bacterium]|jgi:hypothetical protein